MGEIADQGGRGESSDLRVHPGGIGCAKLPPPLSLVVTCKLFESESLWVALRMETRRGKEPDSVLYWRKIITF